jgi:histidinol-phosphatase (PHP family)
LARDTVMILSNIVDCHVHSNFSVDSLMPTVDGCAKAIETGLGGVAFTDHIDIDLPNQTRVFNFDCAVRSQHINVLRQQYGEKLKILKGIEIGIQPHVIQKSEKIINTFDFDFVICSIHAVDGIDLGLPDFYVGKTKQQTYQRYLEAIYHSVCNFKTFDVVGHIGYICRYSPYEDKLLSYADHQDVIDEILKRVIKDGRGIEINTAGYFYKLGMPHPDFTILRRYKELGGEIITIGSDAHAAQRIGADFDKACELLRKAGFKHVAYFQSRMPIFVQLI